MTFGSSPGFPFLVQIFLLDSVQKVMWYSKSTTSFVRQPVASKEMCIVVRLCVLLLVVLCVLFLVVLCVLLLSCVYCCQLSCMYCC